MYQKVTLVGRLGRDPDMRYSPTGIPVAKFGVATDRKWTDADGRPQQKTVWFNVTTWRKLAETCNQYLTKGQLVLVEGELEAPRTYQDKIGEWRASLDLTATTVKFLSRPRSAEGEQGEPAADTGSEAEPDLGLGPKDDIPL